MCDLWWTKWHWDRDFPNYFGFPCQFHSTSAPLHGKTEKLITFVTELHNKTQGCGASVASAVGPFTTKQHYKNCMQNEIDNIFFSLVGGHSK
jgi:hypothetical protein